jgi:glucosamine kinase
MSVPIDSLDAVWGLGIDAGGTQTRWCLMNASGEIVSHGQVRGLSALLLSSESGTALLSNSLIEIERAVSEVLSKGNRRGLSIHAGFTGVDGSSAPLHRLLADAFELSASQVAVSGDIEIAHAAAFSPGEGYLVYAGTGSIAAFVDVNGALHRAGGRGVLLDDAGGGYWIAREALRHVWRMEDERPGAWRGSEMAVALFDQLGGSQWSSTREFFYIKDRGDIGLLAISVAKSAAHDPIALQILERAGEELARLARCLLQRFGSRPVALAGRVAQLHPVIERSMRGALSNAVTLRISTQSAHDAAAKMALARSVVQSKTVLTSMKN